MIAAEESSKFISFNRSILRTWGLWSADDHAISSKWKCSLLYIYRGFTLFLILLFNVTEIYSIYTVIDDVVAATENAAYLIESICLLAKVIIFISSRSKFNKLLKCLHSEEFKPKHQSHIELWNKRARSAQNLSKWYFYVSMFTIAFMNFAPMIEGTNEMPCDVKFPYVDTNTSPAYEICYASIVFSLFVIACTNCALDMVIASFMLQALAQLDCLIYTLEHIVEPISFEHREPSLSSVADNQANINMEIEIIETSDRNKWNYAETNMKHAVRRHVLIIKFVKDLEDMFGLQISVVYLGSALVICFTGIQIISVTANPQPFAIIAIVSFLAAMLSEIFIPCWFGNEIMSKSEQLSLKIFHTEWMYCSPSFKNSVKILMCKTHSPIILRAGKIFLLNLKSFATILNTAYSYFTLLHHLQTVKDQDKSIQFN